MCLSWSLAVHVSYSAWTAESVLFSRLLFFWFCVKFLSLLNEIFPSQLCQILLVCFNSRLINSVRNPSSLVAVLKLKAIFNHLKDEAYLFYIRTHCVPRCKHSPLRL
jgi:hypothetical protein